MATAYKAAQVQGTSDVDTYATLYGTTVSTEAVVSSIIICNTTGSPQTYRIGIDTTEGTPSSSEWVVYGATAQANDTVCLTLGVCLQNSRYLRVSSSDSGVTFSAFVSEIS